MEKCLRRLLTCDIDTILVKETKPRHSYEKFQYWRATKIKKSLATMLDIEYASRAESLSTTSAKSALLYSASFKARARIVEERNGLG